MNVNPIELRKVRDFGDILNTTFAFLKENFKGMAKSCLPVALPIVLAGAIITGFSFSKFFSAMGGMAGGQYDPATTPMPDMSFVGLIYLGYFILMIGLLFFYVCAYQYIILYLSHPKDQITFQLVWSTSKGAILPLIGLSIIVGILLTVGFLFLIIPGIYLMMPLAFTFIIYMAERKGVFASIGRSFDLISGEWFSSFGLAIVMWMVQSAIGAVVVLPFYFIMAAIMLHSVSTGTASEEAAQGMMSNMGIMYAFIMPLYFLVLLLTSTMQVICISLKYFSIVEAKEGVGMMQKVEQMQPNAGTI